MFSNVVDMRYGEKQREEITEMSIEISFQAFQ